MGAGDYLFGNDETAGVLGTGQYKTKPINPNVAEIPGYGHMQGNLAQGAIGAGQRQAPTMQAAVVGPAAQVDASQQGEFRGQQSALAQALMAQANGQGPSLAQNHLRQATDRSLAQALALGASQRGAGAGSALRNIANQQSAISGQAAADSANLALTEQMGARNQLGQVLAGARGQDLALAGQNAQLASQTQLAQAGFTQDAAGRNQDAGLRQQALNDNLVQFYTAQGLSLAQAQQQARMQLAQLQVSQQGIDSGAYSDAANRWQQFGQQVASGLGQIPLPG